MSGGGTEFARAISQQAYGIPSERVVGTLVTYELVEYTNSSALPSLALLVNHDDDRREYAYESVAGSFESHETITETAARLGWTPISMKEDWATVFPCR